MSDNENNRILEHDNLRKTRSRRRIVEILQGSEPKTAEEIFLALRELNEKTSLSTVYRTCETLAQKGTVIKSNLIADGKTRYEYNKSGHMHHAVCLSCRRIIPIDDCPFGNFSEIMKDKFDFDVTSHRLELYGYCRDCRKKQTNGKDE